MRFFMEILLAAFCFVLTVFGTEVTINVTTVAANATNPSTPTPLYSMCDPSATTSACGQNAICVPVPGCKAGLCRCQDGAVKGRRFYPSSNGFDCVSSLALGDKCSGAEGSASLPLHAECSEAGTVICETNLVQQGRYDCAAPATWINTMNVTCKVNGTSDCNPLLGLECIKGSCFCKKATSWNGQICEPTIVEECRNHADCRFVYGEDAVCIHNRRCVCGAGSLPVLYSQLSIDNYRKFFISNYCAPERSPMNLLDRNCTLPGFPTTGSKQYCGRGLVCHHCPEYGLNPDAGRCLNLTSSNYDALRVKVYKLATVDGLCSTISRS